MEISVPVKIRKIRWNPFNQDQLAVTCLYKNEIYFIRLEAPSNRMKHRIVTTGRPSTTINDVIFAKLQNETHLIAADADGSVFLYKLRNVSKPVWTVSLSDVGGVVSLCLHRNNRHLYCATTTGRIIVRRRRMLQ